MPIDFMAAATGKKEKPKTDMSTQVSKNRYAFIHKCVAVTNKQSTKQITAQDVKADAIEHMEHFLRAFKKFEQEFKAEQENEKERESKPKRKRQTASKKVEQQTEPQNGDIFSKLKADKKLFPDTYKSEALRLGLPLDPEELTLKNAEALHMAINAKTDSQGQTEY